MRLSAPAERGVAHGLFQQPEGRQVLGRTAADDVGPVTLESEPGRERPERGCGEPVEEVEPAAGESEADRHRGQASGSRLHHCRDAPAGHAEHQGRHVVQ